MDYTIHGILQARILVWVTYPFSSRSSDPGIELRSPALQTDSLPAESHGKPKNTGVGSLSLLQQIFLTQELNQGLLHYRQILYQLSYRGSLFMGYFLKNTFLLFEQIIWADFLTSKILKRPQFHCVTSMKCLAHHWLFSFFFLRSYSNHKCMKGSAGN